MKGEWDRNQLKSNALLINELFVFLLYYLKQLSFKEVEFLSTLSSHRDDISIQMKMQILNALILNSIPPLLVLTFLKLPNEQ